MQILNLAALFAVIGASNAFNNRHVQLAKRQLPVVGAAASGSNSVSISASSTFSTSSSSSSQVTSTSTTSRQSTNSQSTSTSTGTVSGTTQQTLTTTASGGSQTQTGNSSSTSLVLTGDATLTASGVPPLASISSGMPTEATSSLATTYTPGATPPISGAPTIPTFVINPSDWPTMDKGPDVNSPEVQEWMTELDGYNIPDIPTTDGTCQGSPQAAANAQQNAWWTCGSWTRPTDITVCPTQMTWGVSFDDGPSYYTPKLLDYLSAHDINATFFVVGSRAIEFSQTLVTEYMSGHEIAVHTWSHPPLTSQTNAQIVAELGWTRKAIQAVTGVTPVYMRPPYGDIDDRVRAISLAMGLAPIIWTKPPNTVPFDTNDWRVAGGMVDSVTSYETFEAILGNATTLNTGFIVLEHDLFEVTVDLAVGYTLNSALSHEPPFTLEPILKCQGFPSTDIYRETTTNKTFPYPNSTSSDISGDSGSGGGSNTPGGGGSGSSAVLLHPPALIAGLITVLLSALW